MLREGLHYLAGHQGMRRLAATNPVARKLASRFVAGETLAEALGAIQQTNRLGMRASLDHLGENVTSREEAAEAADGYCQAFDAIAANSLDANISCKLTHLGLDLGVDVAEELTRTVAEAAARNGNFLRLDMEGSAYTERTVSMTKSIFDATRSVGTVIQAYLYRSADDIRDLNGRGIRVRLVKGAYLEPASVAYPNKADVDASYRRLADALLADGTFPAFATHDIALIEYVKDRARSLGRGPEDFEFQMLYGVRRDLQRRLRAEGYGMRLYIPYGTQWYPYLMRRLAERPANLLFIMGNVAREAGTARRSGTG